MEVGSKLLESMQREKQLLLEAERITEEMQTAPAEELPEMTSRRGRFLEEACRLREEERRLCTGNSLLLSAWSNAADPEKLSPGGRQVYNAALAVKNVANRIRNNSGPARARMEHEQQALREKLEELNSSPVRTIEKYKHVMRGAGAAYPGRDRKI